MGTTTYGTGSSSDGLEISSTGNLSLADPFDETALTWTEIVSSTPEAWAGFSVNCYYDSSVQSSAASHNFINFAVGAASSEVRIATIVPTTTYRVPSFTMYIPIPVAASSRLSVAMVAGANRDYYINIVGHHASDFDVTPSFTVMDCGPFDLDDYTTTAAPAPFFPKVDPGAVANTSGPWTEISFTGGTNRSNNVMNGNSLPNTYEYLGLQPFHAGNAVMANFFSRYDAARGAASSEVAFVEDRAYRLSSSEVLDAAGTVDWYRGPFSSGTRISIRTICQGGTQNSRVTNFVLYGVR